MLPFMPAMGGPPGCGGFSFPPRPGFQVPPPPGQQNGSPPSPWYQYPPNLATSVSQSRRSFNPAARFPPVYGNLPYPYHQTAYMPPPPFVQQNGSFPPLGYQNPAIPHAMPAIPPRPAHIPASPAPSLYSSLCNLKSAELNSHQPNDQDLTASDSQVHLTEAPPARHASPPASDNPYNEAAAHVKARLDFEVVALPPPQKRARTTARALLVAGGRVREFCRTCGVVYESASPSISRTSKPSSEISENPASSPKSPNIGESSFSAYDRDRYLKKVEKYYCKTCERWVEIYKLPDEMPEMPEMPPMSSYSFYDRSAFFDPWNGANGNLPGGHGMPGGQARMDTGQEWVHLKEVETIEMVGESIKRETSVQAVEHRRNWDDELY
ncbi:uncharacterized protein PAC_06290 [Phialocephala subalpina]|uniref:Uncharacterized protein n=1 Tax=Phialocephala subalpina TaxID=576137 RepID=A0A1L7WUE1_9HELO|nr:uncharacterized protein PAC_06290 [Phialocephala subalpina]